MAKIKQPLDQAIAGYDKAISAISAWYNGPPPIANTTPQAIVDEIGFLKELQSEAEKTENALWGRLSVLQGGGHNTNSKGVPTPEACDGDVFKYKPSTYDREAILQNAVKAYMAIKHKCTECGAPIEVPNFMGVTEVATKKVERK